MNTPTKQKQSILIVDSHVVVRVGLSVLLADVFPEAGFFATSSENEALSVLAEKQSARSADDMTGHSSCHKVINFRGGDVQPGEIVNVLITEVKSYSLYGKLIEREALAGASGV